MAGGRRLQAVAETRAFSEEIDAVLSPAERDAVIANIASEPQGGDLIPGTGGLRKRRIPLPGRGKRGGARVITLYVGDDFPTYAIFMYAKNERADLSALQKKVLTRVVADIRAQAEKRMGR
jgi:hypothetical protein